MFFPLRLGVFARKEPSLGTSIMHVQLAWRNIWRNPRRTTIILIAIVIGIWTMIVGGALMRGMIDQMVDTGIATLTGHIQIHAQGYRNDPVVEYSMAEAEILPLIGNNLPSGAHWSARVRVNAIASNAHHSSGVTLVGIDPDREASVSFLGHALRQGRNLETDDAHGIFVGQALLETFETKLGHKLVLMTQNRNNDIASRGFRIVGVYQSDMEATEKQFVFIPLEAAQDMLGLEDGISEVVVLLPEKESVNQVATALKETLPKTYDVADWQELLPIMTIYLGLMDSWVFIWYLVIFIAMGFGIVNTLLMAVFERIREFGLLKALGMKPWWIIRGVLTESFLLLVIGAAMGNLLGFLTIGIFLTTGGIDLSSFAAGTEYFGMSRVIYPAVHGQDLAMANMVVFILGLTISLYPASKAARFKVVEALAHT